MAKTQYYYIQRKKAESGQTGTATYDLPDSGIIPELVLVAYSTPTASTDPALPLNKAITKVEIVDGATVIKSLTGNQIMGLYLNTECNEFASTEINDNAVEGHETFHIPLGRKIDGVNYAPDFSKFQNPQIKISWDYSQTTGPFGATFDADTDPSMKFTVMAKIVRDTNKYTPGYIKSNQIKTWTSSASTEVKTVLPKDRPLVGIMVEAGYDDKNWTDDINEIKLSFNNGEWEPIHLYADDIVPWVQSITDKPKKVSFNMDLKDAVEIDSHMGYLVHITGTGASSAGRSFEFDDSHKGVEAVGYMDVSTPAAISTYEQVRIEAIGYLPYQCFYIPASSITDGESDIIDTTRFDRADFYCTSGANCSTSSTPAIVTEYLIIQ